MQIYSLLNKNAKGWWYHRHLREQGKADEARKLERQSILDTVKTLREAVFATVGRGGWTIHSIGYNGSPNHLTRLQGYGGIENSDIQACILLGIPVCDSTTISDDDIFTVTGYPMASHPEADNLDYPPYRSMSYAPFGYVFDLYAKLGATIYNHST